MLVQRIALLTSEGCMAGYTEANQSMDEATSGSSREFRTLEDITCHLAAMSPQLGVYLASYISRFNPMPTKFKLQLWRCLEYE